MESKISEIAKRIKGLREMMGLSPGEMALASKITVEEYELFESGKADFSVIFLCNCARKFGVDLTELMTGENPRLSGYSVVRKGEGFSVTRREGFSYGHLAYNFKNKLSEPFLVKAPYSKETENAPIPLSSHEGQEFDFILEGSLKISVGGHIEVLEEGDSIFYDSSKEHGMTAVGNKDCLFLAVVMRNFASEG